MTIISAAQSSSDTPTRHPGDTPDAAEAGALDASLRFSAVPDPRPVDTPWREMSWPPAPGVKLRGRIVELSPAVADLDADATFDALDHDRSWAFVSGRPHTSQAMADVLRRHIENGRFPWIVRLHTGYRGLAAGAVVGMTSYLEVSAPDARLEIGWTAYTPDVWGTLVNPDTKLVLLSHAFDALGAGRVQLKTDVRNVRSQSAIARLGARHEGTLRRYQRRGDGTVRDTVMFSIVAEEWPSVKRHLVERLDAAP